MKESKYKKTVTVMLVRRDALKRFKGQAVEMQRSMIVLYDQISKLPVGKLRELLK